ncbi:helix-turn-helix transcriptional regulator [Vallitalea guaymasensis]|uniref:helix-turn-helix transcriptional regulator n=1 Tax=Vallitalea guaymasensis TaxID=1185412 RepID=UPI002356168D|nr:AraC family transcriptional regulator [Vallitalea guaymasensis]
MTRKITFKKGNKAQYKRKILYAYLFLIMIYTIIVIVLHSVQELNQSRVQTDMRNNFYFNKITDDIDYKINTLFNVARSLPSNEFVRQYSEEGQNYYAITKVCQKLGEELDVFTNLNSKIYLNKIGEDLFIMPNQTATLKRIFPKSNLSSEDLTNLHDYFVNQKIWQKKEPLYFRNKEQLIYIFNLKINMKNDLLCFLVFDKKDILPTLSEDVKEIFTIYDGAELLNYNSNIVTDEKELSILDNNKKEFYKYQKKSNTELRWNYVYYVNKNHKYISPIFILGYIIITILGIVLAVIWSKIVYRPIKRTIYSIKENPQFEIQGNEFDLITTEVNQMKFEKKTLEQKVKENNEIVRKRNINRIFHGLFTEADSKRLDIRLNINTQEPCLAIVLQLKELLSDDSRVINIHNIYNELNYTLDTNDMKEKFESIEINANRIGLIINEDKIDKISILLKNFIIGIEERCGMNIIASFGSTVTDVFEIEQSYKTAIKILEYQFAFNKIIITESDISGFDDSFYYPLEVEQNLINLSLAGKQEEVLQVMDYLLEENLQLRTLSADVLSQFIFAVAGTLNRVISKVSGIDNKFKEDIKYAYLELKMCNTKQQLGNKIKEIFMETLECIKKNNVIEEFKHIDNIIDYINLNFHKDLSLTDLAEKFNLSAGYVGIIFKKSQGINFKDYINTLKVRKAKEIMKNNREIKIKDLSNDLGFNSTNTFIRIFKKYEGVSPGTYKDTLK